MKCRYIFFIVARVYDKRANKIRTYEVHSKADYSLNFNTRDAYGNFAKENSLFIIETFRKKEKKKLVTIEELEKISVEFNLIVYKTRTKNG